MPSQSSRQYLLSLGVPKTKLRLVGRGVDSHFFNPAKRNPELRAQLAPNNEVLLLCVSRLSLEKGFDFLADAYARTVQQAASFGLRQKFRLVITGGNSNQAIQQHIQSLFEKKGFGRNFYWPTYGRTVSSGICFGGYICFSVSYRNFWAGDTRSDGKWTTSRGIAGGWAC